MPLGAFAQTVVVTHHTLDQFLVVDCFGFGPDESFTGRQVFLTFLDASFVASVTDHFHVLHHHQQYYERTLKSQTIPFASLKCSPSWKNIKSESPPMAVDTSM